MIEPVMFSVRDGYDDALACFEGIRDQPPCIHFVLL